MANNPHFSTGFRNALLDGTDLTSLFDGGVIEIYSGTQPADADSDEGAGTLLASISLPDGSEQITNGGFGSDTDWTKGTGWTIGGGTASSDGTQSADSDLTQTPSTALIQNVEYEVTFTVSNYSAGNVTPVVGDTEGTDRSANGTYTEIITAGAGADIDIRADLDFVGDIDDVSVKIHSFQGSASSGALTVNGDQADDSANATGTAAWFRIKTSGDGGGASTTEERIDGEIGTSGSDLNIDTTSITSGDNIIIENDFSVSISA